MIRTMMVTAALAAVIAAPASAVTPRYLRDAPVSLATPQTFGSDLAVKGRRVVGEDPDANVRFELERDNPYY